MNKTTVMYDTFKVTYHTAYTHDEGTFMPDHTQEKQYITPEFIQGIIDNPGTMGPAIVQLCKKYQALSLDAARYRFLRDKDLFGNEDEPGLVTWDGLAELDCAEFDEAIDDRMKDAL